MFFAPGELPVGKRRLSGCASFPGGFGFPFVEIDFHVDGPSGPGCRQVVAGRPHE